jgi:hypothetical protein
LKIRQRVSGAQVMPFLQMAALAPHGDPGGLHHDGFGPLETNTIASLSLSPSPARGEQSAACLMRRGRRVNAMEN